MPIEVASDPRFSIVPDDPTEVAAVKHAAKILGTNQKTLVLAAMWHGIRAIIMDRDLIETRPLSPQALLAAASGRDLRDLVRKDPGPGSPMHHPPVKDGTDVVGKEERELKASSDQGPPLPAKKPRRRTQGSKSDPPHRAARGDHTLPRSMDGPPTPDEKRAKTKG